MNTLLHKNPVFTAGKSLYVYRILITNNSWCLLQKDRQSIITHCFLWFALHHNKATVVNLRSGDHWYLVVHKQGLTFIWF